VVGAFDGKVPLVSEIALVTGFRVGRDKGYEQTAVMNSLANLTIPGVSTPQLALVKPNLNASSAESPGKPFGSLDVL
jgi:hypothetical protein